MTTRGFTSALRGYSTRSAASRRQPYYALAPNRRMSVRLNFRNVPVGSIARGRKIASAGPNGIATACATCHGPTLRGVGVVPPIAGRSPADILRHLRDIKSGARHDLGSVPMLAVVEKLTVPDMVALAAYVGSRAP